MNNKVSETEQPLVLAAPQSRRAIELPGAPPVRLQTLDLARHIAIAPNDQRYVVATFDDRRLGRGYITAAYPQQNGYLTLVRLSVCELSSETIEQAEQRHVTLVHAIQQGKLKAYLKAHVK